jgi:hypothetical protein
MLQLSHRASREPSVENSERYGSDSEHWTLDTSAPPIGFEPTISTVTGWRALLAAPRGRVEFLLSVAQLSFELSTLRGWSHLRVDEVVCCFPSLIDPGWTRTTDRLLVRELPSPLGHRTLLLFILLIFEGGSRGTRTHNEREPAPVFKTGSSSSRMTSTCHSRIQRRFNFAFSGLAVFCFGFNSARTESNRRLALIRSLL